MDDQTRQGKSGPSRPVPRRARDVPELPQEDQRVREYARLVRRYRRQAIFAVPLALTIFLHQYMSGGDLESWLVRLQAPLAGCLIIDVLVRPVLRRIVPTKVIVQYGEYNDY